MSAKFVLLPPLKRSTELLSSLLSLWEASVRVSHFFLSEADIQSLIPLVNSGIQQIPVLVVAMENDQPVGFMGIEGKKLEMLFVLPEYFGKGFGKELVKCALDQYGVTKVDVNEQNPHAAEFYRRMGFRLSHRSELDGQGNPFPIWHCVLISNYI